MSAPHGVQVTQPDIGPETWVCPVADRWVTVRFWPASESGAKREYPPYATVLDPTYERRLEPEDLERYADTLTAAAKHLRQVRAERERDDTHLTLFEEAS